MAVGNGAGSGGQSEGSSGMALTTIQVGQAGKPGIKLNAGKHHDGNGLYAEIRNANSGSWFSRVTIDGKERWINIGPIKDIPLKRAREINAENRQLVAEGIDPVEHRKTQRATVAIEAAKRVTFAEAAERFIVAHEAGWRNSKHRQQWRNTLATYVNAVIGELPVQAVDTNLAMRILSPIWTAKPETASRVRGRCEQIWDAVEAMGLCRGENPFAWKKLRHLLPAKAKVRSVKHHAAVPYRDIPVLMEKLRRRVSMSARTLEFVILCASRVNEAVLARGCELDLANARWIVPGARMKGGRPHTVMLSKRAVEIVRELHPDGLKPDALIFDITGAALTKMLRLAGHGNATVHGTARAGFKTWCDECTTYRDAVSEACLAHIEGDKVKAAYARGEFEQQRRELMELWSQYCTAAPVDDGSKVVPIRQVS
jgi:integrase